MKNYAHNQNFYFYSHQGFTLVELMVALSLGLFVTGILYSTYISAQRSFTSQEQTTELQSTSMISLEFLSRDIKEAGFGIPKLFDKIYDEEEVIRVESDGSSDNPLPDELYLLGGYKVMGELVNKTNIGDESIRIKKIPGVSSEFTVSGDELTKKNHCSVMGLQYLKLTGITKEGEEFILYFAGSGINKKFPEGAPVYLVEDVTYVIDNEELKSTRRYGMPQSTFSITDNVDDLQIVGTDENRDSKFEQLQIFLLSKSSTPDPNFKDKGHDLIFDDSGTNSWSPSDNSDSYRRRLLSLTAAFRNDM